MDFLKNVSIKTALDNYVHYGRVNTVCWGYRAQWYRNDK